MRSVAALRSKLCETLADLRPPLEWTDKLTRFWPMLGLVVASAVLLFPFAQSRALEALEIRYDCRYERITTMHCPTPFGDVYRTFDQQQMDGLFVLLTFPFVFAVAVVWFQLVLLLLARSVLLKRPWAFVRTGVFIGFLVALWTALPDDIDRNFHDRRQNALVRAAGKGDGQRIAALIAEGVDPNALGRRQLRALDWAAKRKSEEGFAALIANGVDPNGCPPTSCYLQRALTNPDSWYLRQLLAHGANPNMRGTLGPVMTMSVGASYQQNHVAILLDAGADIDALDNLGGTALMQSIRYTGQPEVAELLLRRGADWRVVDKRGESFSTLLQRELSKKRPAKYAKPYEALAELFREIRALDEGVDR